MCFQVDKQDKESRVRLRRCIIELLYRQFMDFPYALLDLESIAEHCEVEAKLLNWNIVYLEKCGYVELGKSIEALPFVACSASITAPGIDLVEDEEQLNARFPMVIPQRLPEIPDARADDLHHVDFTNESDLSLFMAGNQFMVMESLLRAFKQQYPEIRRIYYQTLPPGLSLKQIIAGGAMFRGKVVDSRPDVYASVNGPAMEKLVEAGKLEPGAYSCYLHNRLSLMVPEGNPAGIESVLDLGRGSVKVSQPDPANEDIGFHIIDMYEEAGGRDLVRKVMEQKRAGGTTLFTRVHHRETPLRIELGTVDVGPVWATEIQHARATGMKIDAVEPGERLDQRNRVNYYIARLKNAPNPENAEKFINFLSSPDSREIYSRFGFVPHK